MLVQWHPELMADRYPSAQQLFDEFVRAAGESKDRACKRCHYTGQESRPRVVKKAWCEIPTREAVCLLAIKNVTLYTITNGIVVGNLIVDDSGRIADVGDVPIPDGVEVIDGTGKILMPGLIDAHGHAGVYEEALGWEGADGNEAVDPITPQLRAVDALNPHEEGIKEALAAGVTTMCVLPGSANVIGGQGVIIHTHGNTVDEMVLAKAA